MEDWKTQFSFKIGNHMTNHRFSTSAELQKFMGLNTEPTAEMILDFVVSMNKKINSWMTNSESFDVEGKRIYVNNKGVK
jgi:hypothetical protein